MHNLIPLPRLTLLAALLVASGFESTIAAEESGSGFGKITIPMPEKPADATSCVEPVEIMRRDHMKFLLHQRDATVLQGDRGSKYSLTGCMNCHNPASAGNEIIRYENPKHFCASCHRYASVKIDCFECHADRGMDQPQQSYLTPGTGSRLLSMHTFRYKPGQPRDD